MTSIENRVIEKVQRLLALGSSPQEHEAKAAMAKAQALMMKHNLSMDEVSSFKSGEDEWVEDKAWSRGRAPYYQDAIMHILDKYFFVQTLSRREPKFDENGAWERDVTTLVIFGKKENVKIAVFVAEFLSRTFQSLWKKYKKETRASRRQLKTYYAGLKQGFMAKLREEREKLLDQNASMKGALVEVETELMSELNSRYNIRFQKSSPLNGSRSVYDAGFEDGKQINLREGVTNESQAAALGERPALTG